MAGDTWRWSPYHRKQSSLVRPTIYVIDAKEPRPEPPGARRVPFGFSPRDELRAEAPDFRLEVARADLLGLL